VTRILLQASKLCEMNERLCYGRNDLVFIGSYCVLGLQRPRVGQMPMCLMPSNAVLRISYSNFFHSSRHGPVVLDSTHVQSIASE
jgi:hypothetical protein